MSERAEVIELNTVIHYLKYLNPIELKQRYKTGTGTSTVVVQHNKKEKSDNQPATSSPYDTIRWDG